MKHIPYNSIGQFRDVVKNVQHQARYIGKDVDGNARYNISANMPTIKFTGTVKGHGCNSAVVLSPDGQMYVQSRSNIITPEKDNAGFAMFVESKKDTFRILLDEARIMSGVNNTHIVIFGEFAGGSIQKGVAVNQLPKMFIIFDIAVYVEGAEQEYTWFTKEEVMSLCCENDIISQPRGSIPTSSEIYCIYDFPVQNIEIDFDDPHDAINPMNKMTELVGDECPIGKAFGVSGVGEGLVWKSHDHQHVFKVKDDRH